MKNWFWDNLGKSNIISGLLAFVIWGAIVYLAVAGQEVPEILIYGGSSVIAFFFGSKAGQQEERVRHNNKGT